MCHASLRAGMTPCSDTVGPAAAASGTAPRGKRSGKAAAATAPASDSPGRQHAVSAVARDARILLDDFPFSQMQQFFMSLNEKASFAERGGFGAIFRPQRGADATGC